MVIGQLLQTLSNATVNNETLTILVLVYNLYHVCRKSWRTIDLFISHYIKIVFMFKTVCVNYPNTTNVSNH